MVSLFALVGIGVVVFASTNVDDIFVLLSFFADPKFKARQIVFGQFIGITALFAVSVFASLVSLVLPGAYVGLLGVVPIFLGLRKLWELRRTKQAHNLESEKQATAGWGNILAVAGVTLANGGDNIGIYTPLFAIRPGSDVAIIGVVFFVMTGAWLAAAHFLTNHRTLGEPIRRYGNRVVPFVLIGLGFLILHEAGSFSLLSRLHG